MNKFNVVKSSFYSLKISYGSFCHAFMGKTFNSSAPNGQLAVFQDESYLSTAPKYLMSKAHHILKFGISAVLTPTFSLKCKVHKWCKYSVDWFA